MNGGNISDGPNEASGSVTDIASARRAKVAPPEVNEKRPPVRTAEQQLEGLKKRYNSDRDRWVHEMNTMSSKLREIRARAQTGLEALRAQLDKDKEMLTITNDKFEKYLNKSMALEEDVERLEARVKELESETS